MACKRCVVDVKNQSDPSQYSRSSSASGPNSICVIHVLKCSSTQLPEKTVEKKRLFLGIGYMMAMGICGIVLTAIGSTLDSIASDCGTTSTAIGTVFVARGIGAVIGAISSAKLYAPPTKGNSIMSFTLGFLIVLMMYIPFITNLVILHLVFAGLGFCTAVTDTGCQVRRPAAFSRLLGTFGRICAAHFACSCALPRL
jgi:predicted MFS family arabinose efflux permease